MFACSTCGYGHITVQELGRCGKPPEPPPEVPRVPAPTVTAEDFLADPSGVLQRATARPVTVTDSDGRVVGVVSVPTDRQDEAPTAAERPLEWARRAGVSAPGDSAELASPLLGDARASDLLADIGCGPEAAPGDSPDLATWRNVFKFGEHFYTPAALVSGGRALLRTVDELTVCHRAEQNKRIAYHGMIGELEGERDEMRAKLAEANNALTEVCKVTAGLKERAGAAEAKLAEADVRRRNEVAEVLARARNGEKNWLASAEEARGLRAKLSEAEECFRVADDLHHKEWGRAEAAEARVKELEEALAAAGILDPS